MNNRIESVFPELKEYTSDDYKRLAIEKPALMVAMTARTGSSHLCSGLGSVLGARKATEIFNGRDYLSWEKNNSNIERYENYLDVLRETSEDYVVFKSNWIDFEYFSDKVDLLFPNLNVVYLDRFDVEAQAVSLFKATVSGSWHKSKNIRSGEPIPTEELLAKFDICRICRTIGELQSEKRSWEDYFFEKKIHPARVFYEHFEEDLPSTIDHIFRHFGIEGYSGEVSDSEFSKLSDAVNEEWIGKVRNYRNGNFFARHFKNK